MKFSAALLEDLLPIAEYIKKLMRDHHFFILDGEMGSGKTALVKSLAKVLDIKDEVSSPTYSLVNEYLLTNDKKLFHFDLYRVEDIEELFEIGIEEYFRSNNYCFVEWPDLAHAIFPEEVVEIRIEVFDGKREISINSLRPKTMI